MVQEHYFSKPVPAVEFEESFLLIRQVVDRFVRYETQNI